MRLKVGMVARTINLSHIRGTGRYVQELLRNLHAGDGVDWLALGHNPAQPLHLPTGFDGGAEVFDQRGDRFYLWEQWRLPQRARSLGLQVLHCADNTAPVWQPVPTVVTIHDAVPWTEDLPGPMAHFYMHPLQRMAFERSAAVITISENSRRDIEARWPEVAHKLVVIPHGIADEFFDDRRAELPQALEQVLDEVPYLMYLGGPQPRKRFDWALKLLAGCGRRDVHLVACGFASGSSGDEQVPPELKHRVHFAPYIDDAQLVSLYRGALATLYPTRYEGFGFPAVESQAAGTPVVFSPVSSLVDLVGPLSWTPPLDDFEAWRLALHEILALDADQRANRAAHALAWARQFAWRTSALKHAEVYERVAQGALR